MRPLGPGAERSEDPKTPETFVPQRVALSQKAEARVTRIQSRGVTGFFAFQLQPQGVTRVLSESQMSFSGMQLHAFFRIPAGLTSAEKTVVCRERGAGRGRKKPLKGREERNLVRLGSLGGVWGFPNNMKRRVTAAKSGEFVCFRVFAVGLALVCRVGKGACMHVSPLLHCERKRNRGCRCAFQVDTAPSRFSRLSQSHLDENLTKSRFAAPERGSPERQGRRRLRSQKPRQRGFSSSRDSHRDRERRRKRQRERTEERAREGVTERRKTKKES